VAGKAFASQLIRVALWAGVGPAAAALGPGADVVTDWISHGLDDDDWIGRLLKAAGSVGSNLAADAFRDIGAQIGDIGNHDLEAAAAVALQRALRQAKPAGGAGFLESDREAEWAPWFAAWDARLSESLKDRESLPSLFQRSEQYDPVRLAQATPAEWWREVRALLILWPQQRGLDLGEFPASLDEHLRGTLRELTQDALHKALREKKHQKGWIAWQQEFLGQIAEQARESHRDLAERIDALAGRDSELEAFLDDRFATLEAANERRHAELLAAIEGRRPPPKSDAELWNVTPSVPNFGFRDELLARVDAAFESSRVVTLHGPGGVGKSQAARRVAENHRADYSFVRWINADGVALETDWSGFAKDLGFDGERVEEARADGLRRLAEERDGWLLIFDNAEDPDQIARYLPAGERGRVMITAQSDAWGAVRARTVPVWSWDDATGGAFLCERVPARAEDAAEARALSAELGGLPLALEQAAAYIEKRNWTFAKYQRHLPAAPLRLLDAFGGNAEHISVWKTVELALTRLAETCPPAVELFELLAFLAPADIPVWLFREYAELLPERLREELDWEDALAALRQFSLVRAAEAERFSAHRLTQRIVRARLGDRARGRAEQAAALVNAGFPYSKQRPETWGRSRELLEHAAAVCGYAEELEIWEPTSRLLNETGLFLLYILVDLPRALDLMRRALGMGEQFYGLEHPAVATLANNLGTTLWAQGGLEGAREQVERALEIDEKLYGPEHPGVATDANNLGMILQDLGDLAGPREQTERALRIVEKVFGPEHPEVARGANNLGRILQDLGDLAGAREQFGRALRVLEKFLGAEHPKTQLVRRNLERLGE